MDKPRVAICLYGQPRKYQEGYNNIINYVKANPDYQFDFFYHTWTKPKDISGAVFYEAAKWRQLPSSELIMEDNIIEKLNTLYKPLGYCSCEPINFDIDKYSILYMETENMYKDNVNNITSQIFSRQSVRDILEKVVLTYNIKYEYVITTRFDFLMPITIKLNILQKNKLYMSHLKLPCKLIADNLIICDVNMFFNVFNIFNNLKNIVDNTELREFIKGINENFRYNIEEIITLNFLYYYKNLDAIIRTDQIPNFS